MRLLFAALFVLTMTFVGVALLGQIYHGNELPWWGGLTLIVVFFGSIVAALVLFNREGFRPTAPWKTNEEVIEELRQKDLLFTESFTARRTFQVEEFDDEGSHYFIELQDGRTLYLNGQYLYDFEPITDNPELNQARKFPCTAFTILRHKSAGYVVDILCSGEVLEPEVVTPPFGKEAWKQGIPQDGTVLKEKTFDQIKVERL